MADKFDPFRQADVKGICRRIIDDQGDTPIPLYSLVKRIVREIENQQPKGISKDERKKWRKAARTLKPILAVLLPELMADSVVLVVKDRPLTLVSRRHHYEKQHRRRTG
jgi:hypothetical protein